MFIQSTFIILVENINLLTCKSCKYCIFSTRLNHHFERKPHSLSSFKRISLLIEVEKDASLIRNKVEIKNLEISSFFSFSTQNQLSIETRLSVKTANILLEILIVFEITISKFIAGKILGKRNDLRNLLRKTFLEKSRFLVSNIFLRNSILNTFQLILKSHEQSRLVEKKRVFQKKELLALKVVVHLKYLSKPKVFFLAIFF